MHGGTKVSGHLCSLSYFAERGYRIKSISGTELKTRQQLPAPRQPEVPPAHPLSQGHQLAR
jgi:hypothetical protein